MPKLRGHRASFCFHSWGVLTNISTRCFILGDGDVFGEYALMNQVVMDHSIITAMPSEVVYITIYDLNNIIPQENLDLYKKSLKKYPNNCELR